MSTSDAFVVGEAWISEHFFTSDATSQSFHAHVLARRKEWDAVDGPTPRSRLIEARGGLQVALADLSQRVEALAEQARDDDTALDTTALADLADAVGGRVVQVLELDQHGLRSEVDGPLRRVRAPGATGRAPLAVVSALPVTTVEDLLAKDGLTLRTPVSVDDERESTRSVARLLSQLFVDEEGPSYALVLAGRWALLAERSRWAEGRYLAVDLQLVVERNDVRRGGELDRALACLSSSSIAPDADGAIWWDAVLEASVKHTVGVSQDLRDGVRLSIEIIANDVVQRRARAGLLPLPQDEAQPLATQSLRFLYRILFLLYAEASPELGVLPTGAPEYDAGYSLDRLREMVQVPLTSDRARHGTHLHESLEVLFRLVDAGHAPAPAREQDLRDEGLTFNALRADLFSTAATAHIDEVGLGNEALQRVLGHLLLSKERRGADRGYISYAELGINQLGAVYEGLMSYTGFFAEEDLYEVARDGDATKGSWVVPADRVDGIAAKDFVRAVDESTGERQPVLHRRGTFVFRLAGRERQQSASYYTPEVLTRFTVGQALEELLDQDGTRTAADDVLRITVCEPALGSGAFAIEAVRQLAEQYLTRRQDERGERIDPDGYPRELQRVKAYIALHNVYGVDLNATAVELAEVSLWLDTMVAGLDAPWFGMHLRRGNSLVGARRAVYRRDQVTDKSWLKAVPADVPMSVLLDGPATGIHHFLLPADGWGAAADAKEAAALAPDATRALKSWRSALKTKPTKAQTEALIEIAHRVEVLWQIAARRIDLAEQGVRRAVPVWGATDVPAGGLTREQVEESLADPDGAYRRLRRVMDAWCALWFWPLTESATTAHRDGTPVQVAPPRLDEWIDALQRLVGRAPELKKRALPGNQTLTDAATWEELQHVEEQVVKFADAKPVADVVRDHPWLEVCERVAAEQGFFHWELDFSSVFLRGGFDLQVGNPPWVRPRSDVDALLAEGDPWWQLVVKPTQAQVATKRAETLALPGMTELVVDGTAAVACTAAFVGSPRHYPHLAGLQPDLYRCFMEQMWRHTSARGMAALIHLESHFTDEKAGALRRALYRRLRRHWHFVNELQLFEIQHQKHYGVTVHGRDRGSIDFVQACWLYHPDSALRSLAHDGDGAEPGMKDDNDRWDLRPHRSRITTVTVDTLATWHAILESHNVPVAETRMVYAVNASASATLGKTARATRIAEIGLRLSAGWHEKNDRVNGRFESEWSTPDSWDDAILQGPHLFVSTPMYKEPNKTLLHHLDWSSTDLEALSSSSVPATAYKRTGDRYDYDRAYDDWGTVDAPQPARDFYRIAWRNMAANSGERTLIPALIPPGSAHIHTVSSLGSHEVGALSLVVVGAFTSSLIHDFAVRTAPKSTISAATVGRLPVQRTVLDGVLAERWLRLNAVTDAYADVWSAVHTELTAAGQRPAWEATWTPASPFRRARDRRAAQVEIDAMVALALGITADELCTVYRTQFAVLYGYDKSSYVYDANGRLVPTNVLQTWRSKGDAVTEVDRTAVHPGSGIAYTYELPFATLDREADMRRAYAEFELRLAERA
jgi:methylase of polypeptide subunit release factors